MFLLILLFFLFKIVCWIVSFQMHIHLHCIKCLKNCAYICFGRRRKILAYILKVALNMQTTNIIASFGISYRWNDVNAAASAVADDRLLIAFPLLLFAICIITFHKQIISYTLYFMQTFAWCVCASASAWVLFLLCVSQMCSRCKLFCWLQSFSFVRTKERTKKSR